MKTFRTLFSGGELFGCGARAAGWQHLDGYEIDPKIAAVACLNGFDMRVADVCQVDYESLLPVDHLHASPSCKHASQANAHAGETQADLDAAEAIRRAIRAHRGATFSLENVWPYRNFDSFARILTTLHAYGFAVDFRHINAADYGVPQARKRLILRAVRGRERVPPMHPTHRKGGDMFHQPWIGWYAAIADLIPTLPETEPAPWQLARLPKELRETMLFAQNDSQDQHGNSYGATGRAADDPALTIGTNSAGWWKAYLLDGCHAGLRNINDPATTVVADDGSGTVGCRALLLGDQSAGHGVGVQLADACAPSFTVRSQGSNGFPRAYIVGGGNTQLAQIDSHARADGEPMFTISASDGAKKSAAAYLLDGDNARADSGEPIVRTGTEPAMTLRSSRTTVQRAYVGRWVRLTVQALSRFQTVPDGYIGLTAEVNGNGVPCLLAQRIMESLL